MKILVYAFCSLVLLPAKTQVTHQKIIVEDSLKLKEFHLSFGYFRANPN